MIRQAISLVKDGIAGKPLALRSSKWPAVRSAHLKEHPTCENCGGKVSLQVHHVIPFTQNKELELSDSNLITLCEEKPKNCHYNEGHLGISWHAWNEWVRIDAAQHLGRIRQWTAEWAAKIKARP